jgi:hypothetical protein
MNPRRMEAEAVRDAMLYLAGNLDLSLGGPEIDHAKGLTNRRRSLYFRHARERQMEFLQIFDAANPEECYRRGESVRPQQAYALVNSSLALAQSRRLAARLTEFSFSAKPASDQLDEFFVVAAFETVLTRRPSEAELRDCLEFLKLQGRQLAEPAKLEPLNDAAGPVAPSKDPKQRARENLVLVLFNHHDFVTIR